MGFIDASVNPSGQPRSQLTVFNPNLTIFALNMGLFAPNMILFTANKTVFVLNVVWFLKHIKSMKCFKCTQAPWVYQKCKTVARKEYGTGQYALYKI